MKFTIKQIMVSMLYLCFLASCAEFKDSGRAIGHATKDISKAIGHGVRDTVKAIGGDTKDIIDKNQDVSENKAN